MKQVNIRLDDELLKDVKILCVRKGMTLQGAIMVLLEKWVRENKEVT